MTSTRIFVILVLLIVGNLAFEESDSYYKILGIDRKATKKEVKKAYHKMSLEYHPDRNKAPNARDKFSVIAEAYGVLSNEEKRQIYDRGGKEAVKQAEGRESHGDDPFSQFEEMFGGFGGHGGGGRQGGRGQRRKGPVLETKIRLTLEELYKGKEFPFLISKTLVCDHCRGSGAEDIDDVVKCSTCNGQGVRLIRQQVAPGFVQQFQTECNVCGGEGKIIKNKCHVCRGHKMTGGFEKMNIYVEKGMTNGTKIDFSGGARDYLDRNSSDLVFVVQELEHPKYKRKGANLTTLDDRHIKVARSSTSQPGDQIRVSGEGFPVRNRGTKGDLFVTLNIHLPTIITANKRKFWDEYFAVTGSV